MRIFGKPFFFIIIIISGPYDLLKRTLNATRWLQHSVEIASSDYNIGSTDVRNV